jgi:hypothetical protein
VPEPWQVTDNSDIIPTARVNEPGAVTFTISRGKEVGATCFDYGLACVIEATLNLRDGTVE